MEKLDKLLEIMESRAKKAIPKNTVVRTPMIIVEILSGQKVRAKILGYDTIYTLFNKTGHLLFSGDSVMVESSIDNLNNGVVVFKFGNTPVTYGSNSDGFYRKFDDGTLMCWTKFTPTVSAGSTVAIPWTYPFPFIEIPYKYASVGIFSDNIQLVLAGVNHQTAQNSPTAGRFLARNNHTSELSVIVDALAIGRWKT
jgi:hypothetical protein